MFEHTSEEADPTAERRACASTLIVAALIYGGWIAATLAAPHLPPLVLAALGGCLIAWHGSLQHETIHGHPTRSALVNRLLGFPPLSLWLPYDRYRRLHLAHHATEHLTLPEFDTESRYLPADASPMRRAAGVATSTLAGRMVIGPALEIGGFLASEARAVAQDEPGARAAWSLHLVGVAGVVAWLTIVCDMSLAAYLVCFVYPGCALSLLRSFAEHRAHRDPQRRIAVVERAPLLSLLFLNNNLHAVHHAFPGAPWRSLPRLYHRHRDELLQANGGLVYDGYGEVVRRYLFRAHDQLTYPKAAHERIAAEAVR